MTAEYKPLISKERILTDEQIEQLIKEKEEGKISQEQLEVIFKLHLWSIQKFDPERYLKFLMTSWEINHVEQMAFNLLTKEQNLNGWRPLKNE